ncbi:hypothetical protein PsorP6_017446 [Peronosclerospora sorghi]|uniref:Uncharacterized protein n=1 Tax=Peronosclerospora sorghi TaxID=230839 RepID=A0ACC0WLE1_9STRA|nr:hypothetical protein PsorP6_017446 [Peronosclerospora sorghi]
MQYDDAKNEVEEGTLYIENGSARGDDSDGDREYERDDDFEGSERDSENILSEDEADPFADLGEDSNTEFEYSSDDETARKTVKKSAIDRLQIPNVISTQTSRPCQDIYKSRVKEEARQRQTSTRRCDCKWEALIENQLYGQGRYTISSTGEHNHLALDDLRTSREGRVCPYDQIAALKLLISAENSTADIMETMRLQFKESFKLIDKDVQNMKQEYRGLELGGLPEMDSLARNYR